MNMYSHVDHNHWAKAQAERSKLGIGPQKAPATEVKNHPLAGKTVINTATGEEYVVESVLKDWKKGWYLAGVLNHNGFTIDCVVENISSVDPCITRRAERFAENVRPQPRH